MNTSEPQKKYLSLLSKLDAFGVSIQIKYAEAAKYKTRFGGFITLIIFTLLGLLIFQSFYQIYNKSNPNVIFDQRIVTNPSRYDIKADNFNFVLTILDQNLLPFLDESIYTIKASMIYKIPEYDSKQNKIVYQFTSKEIPIGKCNKDSFQVQGTEDYFLKLDYEKMYCVQKFDEIYLQGQFENDEFSVIEFKVMKCGQNKSANGGSINCQRDDQIDEILSSSMLQLYYTNSIVQVNNKESPFKSIGQSYYWEGNVSFQQNINLLFLNTYVEDDDGLFLSQINMKRSLILNSERTMFSSKAGEAMFKLSLYLEKNKENHYQRGYLKIQQAVSQIGGLYNVLFILGCFIVYPYSQMQLNRQLFNSTFSIQRKNHKKPINSAQNNTSPNISPTKGQFLMTKGETGQIDQMTVSPQRSRSEMKRSSFRRVSNKFHSFKKRVASMLDVFSTSKQDMNDSNMIADENDSQNNSSGFIKKISSSFNKIQVNTIEYFSYYFGCMGMLKSESFDILKFGMKKISTYTDICFIINKLLEIEKLKHLILNDEQIKLFEFIPKPKIDSQILAQYKEYQNAERCIKKNLILDSSQLKKQNEKNQEEILMDINNQGRRKVSSNQRDRQINILSIQNRPLFEKALQAKYAFNNIYKGNQKKTKIDLKLIQMLDKDLIGLLNSEEKQNDNYQFKSTNSIFQSKFQNSPITSPTGLLAVKEIEVEKDIDLEIDIDFDGKMNVNNEFTLEKDNSQPLDNYSLRLFNFMNKVRNKNDDPVQQEGLDYALGNNTLEINSPKVEEEPVKINQRKYSQ